MPRADCKFIKRLAEFLPKEEIPNVPDNTRGIYALLKERGKDSFDVVYIGLSARGKACGIASRLRMHRRKKGVDWSHFTILEVHDNISDNEICELEGLFRHIYRKDTTANRLNKQLRYKKFSKISSKNLRAWDKEEMTTR